MKSLLKINLLVTILLTTIHLAGQEGIQLKESSVEHDGSQRPCVQVNLDPEPKTLKNAWKDYLQDNYDFKLKGIGFLSNDDLLTAEEIKVEKLSPKKLNFYTLITEDENGSEMKVFVRFGYDIYLNKEDNPNEFLTLKTMVKEFLKVYLPEYYQNQVSDTEKRIEELEDETKDLKGDIESNTKEISNLKEEIKDLEKELESKKENLDEANTKLQKRKAKLKRINAALPNL